MLDEYMNIIGYTDEEISLIKKSYPISNFTESTLLYNIKNIVNYFRRNGLENKDIVYITVTIPNIICISTETIKIRILDLNSLGFNKLDAFNMIKNYPYIIEMSFQKIKNKYNCFLDLGFDKLDIIKIFTNNTELLNVDQSYIKNRFNYFHDFGYRKRDIRKIFSEIPEIIDCNITKINKKMDEYQKLGFNNLEVIKITSYLPELFITDNQFIETEFNVLLDFGYKQEDIIKIIKKVPIILKNNYLDNISNKLDNLLKIGFIKEEIVTITSINPYILLYSIDFIKDNYNNLEKNDFYKMEIIKMIKDNSIILGYDKNSLNTKIKFYKDHKLIDKIKSNSKLLTFNIDFIKARYKIISNKENYDINDLFISDSEFFKKYCITRYEILR